MTGGLGIHLSLRSWASDVAKINGDKNCTTRNLQIDPIFLPKTCFSNLRVVVVRSGGSTFPDFLMVHKYIFILPFFFCHVSEYIPCIVKAPKNKNVVPNVCVLLGPQ